MARCEIQQIFYSPETRALLDPAFKPLARRADDEPEWREYASFRKVLKSPSLDEDTLYGVLSPRFGIKTTLTGERVCRFVQALPDETDVVLFSPYVREICVFRSVLHQGEARHPGLMKSAAALFQAAGTPLPTDTLVNHALDAVFCNYFLARPAFWRRWFSVADLVLDLDAERSPELSALMSAPVPYRDGALPMSIFVLERITSVILALEPHWRVAAYSPFQMAEKWSLDDTDELVTLDALKFAYAKSRDPRHLRSFLQQRQGWRVRHEARVRAPSLQRA